MQLRVILDDPLGPNASTYRVLLVDTIKGPTLAIDNVEQYDDLPAETRDNWAAILRRIAVDLSVADQPIPMPASALKRIAELEREATVLHERANAFAAKLSGATKQLELCEEQRIAAVDALRDVRTQVCNLASERDEAVAQLGRARRSPQPSGRVAELRAVVEALGHQLAPDFETEDKGAMYVSADYARHAFHYILKKIDEID